MHRHVFLTGPPGIGKTTLIQKVSEVLTSSGVPVDGFYTEEVRQGPRRVGFDVVTMSGNRGKLARISGSNESSKYRVGQYAVDIASFEQLVIPLLDNLRSPRSSPRRPVCVIDEIGKMELFSQPFISGVKKVLDNSSVVVFGTLPVSRGRTLPLVEEVRHRQDVKLFTVTRENREDILHEIVTSIQDCCTGKSK
ncbi:cancer-related nucleoside-triphosphatase homolog [Bufo bufo]|uniref:cancer-related nucleoside-triphosphatase homolog n=1 Tax=Bufo bufo TaxID=8384 RepID=UPI001ABDFE21|nr:cancer-related nucleoside-triphosphatase homolog [Bufo bufo]